MRFNNSNWLVIPAFMLIALSACSPRISTPQVPTTTPVVLPMEQKPPMQVQNTPNTPIAATATAIPASPTPQPSSTSLPPTATSMPPTATMLPPTAPPPATPVMQGIRVSMVPGSTSAQLTGSVKKNGSISYLVGANAKQYMIVTFDSTSNALTLKVQAPDGTTLGTSAQQPTFWQGTLPVNGDYLVSVISSGEAANFNLGIIIPVRVTFAAGAISASVDGKVTERGINTYLLRALKNQTMTVTITAPKNDIFLTIYGLEDGQPYVRSVTGQTSATLKLPATQDYVIECVSTGDAAENYNVQFVVK